MTKEEALKEARRLLKKSGVDTSEMTDAEVITKVEAIWKEMKPEIDTVLKRLSVVWQWVSDELAPAFNLYVADLVRWWESLPEEVRAELKEAQ